MSQNLLEYKIDLIAAHLGVYRIEEVAAVMRREHTRPDDGEIVDVIDFYPPWNKAGTYGRMKVCLEYLDDDWQRARFEKFSGVKVEDIPIYNSKQAMQRRFGVENPSERPTRPFRLMIQPRQDDTGKHDKTLILRYLPAPARTQTSTAPEPTPQPAVIKDVSDEKDWELEAATAKESFYFDTALARAVGWFKEPSFVTQFREAIFGTAEFDPLHAPAYVRGLQAYARERGKSNGDNSHAVHNRAKQKALDAYRHELRGEPQ